MRERKRNITDADRKAAANLRRIWDRKKKELKLTQEGVGPRIGGKKGGSQGLVSQYLNGVIALNAVATLRFAQVLLVSPSEIRDDIDFDTVVPPELPPDLAQTVVRLLALDEKTRRDAIGFLNVVLASGQYVEFVNNAENAAKEREIKNRDDSAKSPKRPREMGVARAKK